MSNWEQYGPYNTGAMNMAQYCRPIPPQNPPPSRAIQTTMQPMPSKPAPQPVGVVSGPPYMQWGQGNLGGLNVAYPSGSGGSAQDNIYGTSVAGSGNMSGSNQIYGGRGLPHGAVGVIGSSPSSGNDVPTNGGAGTSLYTTPAYGECRPGFGDMEATNITNPAYGEHRGPVSMGASNISISNTATYLSQIAPRTGGEYRSPYSGQSGSMGISTMGSQTRLLGGDMRQPELTYKFLCDNCRSSCRQTGGMNRSMSQPSLKSEEFNTKDSEKRAYRPSLLEGYKQKK